MAKITFSLVTLSFTFEDFGPADERFIMGLLDTQGQRADVHGSRFGWSVSLNGQEQEGWDREVPFDKTDQSHLASSSIGWKPDQQVLVKAWVVLRNGARIKDQFEFTVQRPTQPHPSWVWDEDLLNWKSPVAYPQDQGRYIWDEDSVSWLEVPESH